MCLYIYTHLYVDVLRLSSGCTPPQVDATSCRTRNLKRPSLMTSPSWRRWLLWTRSFLKTSSKAPEMPEIQRQNPMKPCKNHGKASRKGWKSTSKAFQVKRHNQPELLRATGRLRLVHLGNSFRKPLLLYVDFHAFETYTCTYIYTDIFIF